MLLRPTTEGEENMVRSALSKVAWVGRTASMVFGLALVLALMLGVATMAFGADGDFFKVGKSNLASAVSTLTKSGAGPALKLNVDSGAPLAVNSTTKVAKLNADRIDNREASSFANGVGGVATNADQLDGKDQSAFASSSHNHDGSYYAAGSKVADSSHADQADSATNAQNAANADTVDGKNAADLVPGGELPAGTTIRGNYEMDGQASAGGLVAGDAISFGYTLPSNPVLRVIRSGETPPAECPGTTEFPQANAGYLCVYEIGWSNTSSGPRVYLVNRMGANIDLTSAGAGESYSYGSWAVTAPAQQLSAAIRQSSEVQQNADVK